MDAADQVALMEETVRSLVKLEVAVKSSTEETKRLADEYARMNLTLEQLANYLSSEQEIKQEAAKEAARVKAAAAAEMEGSAERARLQREANRAKAWGLAGTLGAPLGMVFIAWLALKLGVPLPEFAVPTTATPNVVETTGGPE